MQAGWPSSELIREASQRFFQLRISVDGRKNAFYNAYPARYQMEILRLYMYPDSQIIEELVQRIVEAVHPLRIILFGSAARGEMGTDSDLDVLVIMPDGTHRRKTTQEIYRHMWGFGVAKDIVVVTESDLQAYGHNPYMILKNALEEGRELYHAAG